MTEEIEAHPNVMLGKPVIAGTRITVEHVLAELGAGRTIEELLAAHPRLTREGVLAALRFASRTIAGDLAFPLDTEVA